MLLNELSKEIVDCAFRIHKELGPGLLESVYEECFCYELENKRISFEKQKSIPLVYKNKRLHQTLRLDVVVDSRIVVEIKCVQEILPVHEAQILSYLRLAKIEVGLLINFKTALIKDGIKRFRV